MNTVSLESLNTADKAAFIAALGDIYEHAPWVAQAVLWTAAVRHARRPA